MCKILMVGVMFLMFFECMLNNSTFLGCAATCHYLDFWSVKIFLLATFCGYMQLLSLIITVI